MDYNKLSLEMHEKHKGKIAIAPKVEVKDNHDLSMAYSPGVAEPCRKIHENPEDVYRYTAKGNLVAVATNGTAVLGLGDIGPLAAMPVMEGKAVLFKDFGDVDAFPICIDSKDVDEIVDTLVRIAPTFGGINLEDIKAPECVEIENRLKEEIDIPVFHDDQHGTAIVTVAGLINGLKLVGKKFEDIKVVVNGSGAAGVAIVKMLRDMGVENILILDSKGIVYKGNPNNNWLKEELAEITNKDNIQGDLREAIKDADVFIGVSVAGVLDKDMIKSMAKDPIVFAMANPVPEIFPEDALEAGAKIVGTGRSDYPNQINNVQAFPGIFRGALDARAREINSEMTIAAAHAIASMVAEDEIRADYITPNALSRETADKVAKAVYDAAVKSGVARI